MPASAMPYPTASPTSETQTANALHYAVRVGLHGQVGRFVSTSGSYRRGMQVICRTARGLEVGSILNMLRWANLADSHDLYDGRIVRAMLPEDQLLWNHLRQLADEAQATCQAWLNQAGSADRLLDVEPLLDGRTLYFHFLNQASSATERQIAKLVQIFQETVAGSTFAQQLEQGCGPGCGTETSKGCGSCTTCSVKQRCQR